MTCHRHLHRTHNVRYFQRDVKNLNRFDYRALLGLALLFVSGAVVSYGLYFFAN